MISKQQHNSNISNSRQTTKSTISINPKNQPVPKEEKEEEKLIIKDDQLLFTQDNNNNNNNNSSDDDEDNDHLQSIKLVQEQILELESAIQQGINRIHCTNTLIDSSAELNSDIRSAIKEMMLKIDEMDLLVEQLQHQNANDDDDSSAIQASLKLHYSHIVDEMRRSVNRLQFEQRQANIEYQRKAKQLYQKTQRNKLLASAGTTTTIAALTLSNEKASPLVMESIANRYLTNKRGSSSSSNRNAGEGHVMNDTLVKAGTNNITKSLMNTRELLSGQLSSTANSMSKLSVSRQVLQSAVHSQQNYEKTVEQSSALIKFMKWQEKYEQLMLYAAFAFFCVVCLYVFNKRIPVISLMLYIVKWILSWIPYVLFSASGSQTTNGAPSPSPSSSLPPQRNEL